MNKQQIRQVAEKYAEKKYRKKINSLRLKPWCEVIPIAAEAYSDGYTAAEQSQWRSVEEELPSNDDNVLVYVPTTEFQFGGYEVAYFDGEDWYTTDGEHIRPSYWKPIPSLPDTNTKRYDSRRIN